MTALATAIAWAVGIVAGLLAPGPGWAGVPIALLAAGVAWVGGPGGRRTAALCLATLSLGMAWAASGGGAAAAPLGGLAGEVALVGRVADAPLPLGRRVQFPLEVVRAERRGDAGLAEAGGARVLVRGPSRGVEYGDLVEVRGRLAEPRSRPGYPAAALLARRGISQVADAATIRRLAPAEPSTLGWLHRVRGRVEMTLRSALPEPHASLAAGVLLGTRAGAPPELRAALAATGTTHVVAVSGFNVAVLAALVELVVVRLFGRAWALPPMFAIVWTYTLLVGAPPSAVRAAAMISLVFAARAVGRLPDPSTVLALAGAGMLAWDPRLALDLSFQLSVLATAGLILFAVPIADRLSVLPRAVREPVAVALAAQVATLPIILATFHTLSVIAPLANVLVGPALPGIMLAGGLLAVLEPLPGLGALLSWLSWALLTYVLAAIDWAAELPGAVVFTGRMPPWTVAAWYGLLALWAAAGSPDIRARLGYRPYVGPGLAAATLALLPATALLAAPAREQLAVSVLDVGGPALFVRSADGRSVLVAGRASSGPLAASAGQRLGLWERGLDLVVVADTSAESDGLAETLRRYPAGLVIAPPSGPAQTGDGRQERAAASESGPIAAEVGQRVELGDGAWLEIVDVREQQGSFVLDVQVVVGEVALWLPGPGPASPGWRRVAEDGDVDGDRDGRRVVLRLPSRSLAWSRAAPGVSWLAIVGDGLGSERPGDDAAPDRADLVLDQRIYGAVEAVLDRDGWTLRTERCPAGRGCPVMP